MNPKRSDKMTETITPQNEARIGLSESSVGLCNCPEELKNFIYYITLKLQRHRTLTDEQKDDLFQRAYHFYVKYDVENRDGA